MQVRPDFVGHFETMAGEAEVLLRHLKLWDKFGAHGWGFGHADDAAFLRQPYGKHNPAVPKAATCSIIRDHYTKKLWKVRASRFLPPPSSSFRLVVG